MFIRCAKLGPAKRAILIERPLTLCRRVDSFSPPFGGLVRGGVMVSIGLARLGGSFVVNAVLGSSLLLPAGTLLAQRGGGGSGGPPVAGVGAPSGVDEKDELRGFHRAIAVQATSEQNSEFRALVNEREIARRELDQLVNDGDSHSSAKNADELSSRMVVVRQALDASRAEAGKFVGGFSLAQKTGLKDLVAKLMKAESELGEQEKLLDAPYDAARISGSVEGLRRALANFRSEQDDLAVEMGIVVSEGAPPAAFSIPARISSRTIGGQAVGITTSAVITQASEAAVSGAGDVYKVEATSDLADLQAKMGTILGALMNKEDRCGERVRVTQADLTPELPVGEALVRMHYERWVCSAAYGGNREMTEGNATVDMKVTAGVGTDGQVLISSQIVHAEAEKFLADMLRSGALGDGLKEKMSSSVMAAIVNLKTVVPAAGDVNARSVRFASPREGELSVVVGGEMRMSEAQAQEMERLAKAGTVERSKAQ